MSDTAAAIGNRDFSVRAGALFSALLMLTVPLSTAVSIAMTFLVFICWVLSLQFRSVPLLIRHNPVAAGALILYGLLLVGALYGDAALDDSLSTLRKYRELPLLVILLPFMRDEQHRRWIFTALIAACLVTLLASFLKEIDILPLSRQGTATFKSRITHNMFMAFFAYFCVHQAAASTGRRWLWMVIFLFAVFDLCVIVQGRTGQVIFVLLMALFFFQRLNSRWALALTLVLVVGIIGGLSVSGGGQRFQEGIENSRDYLAGRQDLGTSMGQRLYFWQHSIDLIRSRPVIGYGTGSFASQFSRITGGKNLLTANPHNEYLMIAVQLGAVGLFAYLFFLAAQWRCSLELPEDRRWLAQGVVVSLAVNSLFNTTFLDHTEGHWYACLIALSFAGLPRCAQPAAKRKLRHTDLE
jgi:O-antigen ligase